MLADPFAITFNGVATNLPRTRMGDGISEYVTADGNLKVTIKQTASKDRFRREVRISQQKVSADPISLVNGIKGVSVYMVVDEPKSGFSDTEIGYLIDVLRTSFAQSAFYNRLLGGES